MLGVINDSWTRAPLSSGSKVCHQTVISEHSRTLYVLIPLIYKADPWKYHIASFDNFRELEHRVILRLWFGVVITFSFCESMRQVLRDSDWFFINYDMHQMNENQLVENINSPCSRWTIIWIYINNLTIYWFFLFSLITAIIYLAIGLLCATLRPPVPFLLLSSLIYYLRGKNIFPCLQCYYSLCI